MPLLFMQSWLPDEALKAVCWTLVHSLWQGALAAALAGGIILVTRRSSARLRYNLLGGVLLIFLITAGITFSRVAATGGTVNRPLTIQAGRNIETDVIMVSDDTALSATNVIDRATAYLNTHAGLLVLVWMVLFLFHCMRISAGLAGIRRLQHHKTSAAGDWQIKLDQLSRTLGIRQSVRVLQSELVKVPVAIGFLKPVILVPLGLLAQLPAEQAETILLHELAHIRRKDYLVNLLQCLAEAIFFFNPALLWISSLMRQEREACCDDIVVANTDHTGNYLEALVSFQEYSLRYSKYTMAIGGKQHYLLNRVKRMLTRENKKLNGMEKSLLIAGLTTIMAFTFSPREKTIAVKTPVVTTVKEPAPAKQPIRPTVQVMPPKMAALVRQPAALPVTVPAPAGPAAADTLPLKSNEYDGLKFPSVSSTINDDGTTRTEITSVTDQNGKQYTITKLNNRISSLTVDGKAVPEQEIGSYTPLLQKIESTMQDNRINRQKKDMQRRQGDSMRSVQDLKSRMDEVKRRNADRDRQVKEKRKEITEKHRQVAEQKRQVTERNRQINLQRTNEKRNLFNQNRNIEIRKEQRTDSLNKRVVMNRQSSGNLDFTIQGDIKQAFDIRQKTFSKVSASDFKFREAKPFQAAPPVAPKPVKPASK